MLTLSIFNQKGGVGKTSIACNLAASFAFDGLKTLVVDLDPQANASHYLLGPSVNPSSNTRQSQLRATITTFFENTLKVGLFSPNFREIVTSTPTRHLYLLPADGGLQDLQTKLESRYKIFKLRDALADLAVFGSYDFCIIDCPPALNFYSTSALMASSRVYLPFDCDGFAAQGLRDMQNLVREICEDHNPQLTIGGVIANSFLAGAKQPTQAIKAVEEMGLKVLTPYLSNSVVMRESHDAQEPLISFRPKHKLTQEFAELSRHIRTSNVGSSTTTAQDKA